MNGTARVIVPATVSDIGHGPYVYAACQQCYSKLLEFSEKFSCRKCGRSLPCDKVEYRYRLNMTITDFSTYVMITAFGGMLNAFFGCSASELKKRWMKKLQRLVGHEDQAVTKWALEESLIGCHMHFGFKVHENLLHTLKTQGCNGISLRDIKEHCRESFHSLEGDKNIVVVQVMAQNESQMPKPVTSYLQSVEPLFENTSVVNDEKESCQLLTQEFIQQNDANKRRRSSRQVLPSINMSNQCSSVSSLLDQTSIIFSCNDSYKTTSSKLNESETAQRCNIENPLTMATGKRNISCEMKSSVLDLKNLNHNTLRDNTLYFADSATSLQFIADTEKTITENILTGVEEDDDNECSVLLFESPVSDDGGQEIPRSNNDVNDWPISVLLDNGFELSNIKDENLTQISSDLSHLSLNLWGPNEETSVSVSRFHSIECENGLYFSHKDHVPVASILYDRLHNPVKMCLKDDQRETCIQNRNSETASCVDKCDDEKNSYGESSFNYPDSQEDHNISCNDTARKQVIRNTLMNSCHSIKTAGHHSLLDMPESEDLELFLAVANNSFDQHGKERNIPKNSLTSHELKATSVIKEFDDEQPSYSLANKELGCQNCLSETGLLHSGTKIREAKKLISNTYNISRVRSCRTTEIIHNDIHAFQRGFTNCDRYNNIGSQSKAQSKQIKNMPKFAQHSTDISGSKKKNHAADLLFRRNSCASPKSKSNTSNLDAGEQSCGYNSDDLFSSQESVHPVNLFVMEELSVVDKTNINENDIQPCDNVQNNLNSSLCHDHSFDLFSTPDSKTGGNNIDNNSHFKDMSHRSNLDCNSFELFSSEEEL